MIFDSYLDKVIWKWKVKQISKRLMKGISPTEEELNVVAKPILRKVMEDIRSRKSLSQILNEGE